MTAEISQTGNQESAHNVSIRNMFKACMPVVSLDIQSSAEEMGFLHGFVKEVSMRLGANYLVPGEAERSKIQISETIRFDIGSGFSRVHGYASSCRCEPIEGATAKCFQSVLLQGLEWMMDYEPESEAHKGSAPKPVIFVAFDLHPFLAGPEAKQDYIRLLKNIANDFMSSSKRLVLVGAGCKLGKEFDGLVYSVDYSLPSLEELENSIQVEISRTQRAFQSSSQNFAMNLNSGEITDVAKAAKGLTGQEVQSITRLHCIQNSGVSESLGETLFKTRAQELKKQGINVLAPPEVEPGGLDNFKAWCQRKTRLFWEAVNPTTDRRLPVPKGCLLTGVSGCGKSLAAKHLGRLWGVPVLEWDISSMFGSLVGESEQRVHDFIQKAEAIAPCVVLIDEIEKALSGATSDHQGDSGVSTRMMGTLLTWLNDKTSPVFVVATANDVSAIQAKFPEMLRAGRFDEIFFVDLPTAVERKAIFQAHLTSYGLEVELPDELITVGSNGFIGSEIEQVVKDAVESAYYQDRDVMPQDLAIAAQNVNPMSVKNSKTISELKGWAQLNAQPASVNAHPEVNGAVYAANSQHADVVPSVMI